MTKVHRAITFNQKAWLKPYSDTSTELRKNTKNDFKKKKKLVNNAVFGKTMENVRIHRNIKLVTTKATELFSVRSRPSYNNIFFENLLVIQMKEHGYS